MIDNKALRPVLIYAFENNYRKLTSSSEFLEDLLKKMLKELPTTYFILDGVDEIAETERAFLLKSLMTLLECQNLKLLISSRAEYDITLYLRSHCEKLQVHESNSQDIIDYVDYRTRTWLSGLDLGFEFVPELTRLTKKLPQKSKGVLYIAQALQKSLTG